MINFMGGIGSIIAFLVGSKLYDVNPAYPLLAGSDPDLAWCADGLHLHSRTEDL